MKLTYNWLKEYVDLSGTKPEEIVKLFTSMGVATENLEKKIINGQEDFVFDLEITPNRPDYLSVFGIARLLSSIRNSQLKFHNLKIKESGKDTTVKIDIRAKDACYRYTARIVKNVKIKKSPDWIKDRLEACGIRSINNIVDITNYVLLETGHPIHAFDYDKLEDSTIIVRFASKGEKLVTLDGVERKLDNNILVIADNKKPVALAGVMGGENTEVKENTEHILIESAYFVPHVVRKCSKTLKIMTESSYRFERGADYDAVEIASNRAAQLMQSEASGEVSELIDLKAKTIVPTEINLRVDRTNKILGTNLTENEITGFLKRLYFTVKKDANKLLVTVPCFRNEVSREIDVIEEIAQIYGLNKINSVLPSIIMYPTVREKPEIIEDDIKDLLIGLDFYEVINSGFMDYRMVEVLMKDKINSVLKIVNPLLNELNSMKITLLFGLLENARHNINNGVTNIKIFEIGNTFTSDAKNTEKKSLGIIMTGLSSEKTWNNDARKMDFFEMKGVVEIVFDRLFIKNYKFCKTGRTEIYNENSTGINIDGREIGAFGELEDSVLKMFDIKEKVYFAEIALQDVIDYCSVSREFIGLPRFPGIKRDLAIIIKNNVESSSIIEYIKSVGGELLEKIELFDFYKGAQIPEDCKSLAFRFTFKSSERTLTDSEVNVIYNKIIETLKNKVGAVLRG